MKRKLQELLSQAFEKCADAGKLKRTPIPDYVIEVPGSVNHGHYATNLPMVMASSQRRPPKEIARIILENLEDPLGMIEKKEVAGPGFINFTISRKEWLEILSSVVPLKEHYGWGDLGSGQKVLVEFVSANPTGPLHLGHGRGAALGDTLCRILASQGFRVEREFYINDAGHQVRMLGESIYSRWRRMREADYPFPEAGYHGEYILELARSISEQIDLGSLSPEEAISKCAELGKQRMLNEIKQDLHDFRIHYDVWSSESDLFSLGQVQKDLEEIRKKGKIYEKDGAVWIETSQFGDDKDRVVKKQTGEYTYFASDISYHLEKWKRGYSKAVNIWGADHHGYVQRVKAALRANGLEESWLSVLLLQLVKLWKGGQEVKMSKRAGLYVTLRELIDEVGVDAARFVFLTKHHDSPLDFDIDLVKKKDPDNPVFYVQYAHARICSIFRKAAEEGLALPGEPDKVLHELVLDEEMALIRMMAEFPYLLADISRKFDPHRLTYYLTELASLFHRYFNLGTKEAEKRIVGSEKLLSEARLYLVEAVRTVLSNGLNLLGISAPERM
jgi:arginyl-tRNA synthetase